MIHNAFWVFILPDRNFPNFLMESNNADPVAGVYYHCVCRLSHSLRVALFSPSSLIISLLNASDGWFWKRLSSKSLSSRNIIVGTVGNSLPIASTSTTGASNSMEAASSVIQTPPLKKHRTKDSRYHSKFLYSNVFHMFKIMYLYISLSFLKKIDFWKHRPINSL